MADSNELTAILERFVLRGSAAWNLGALVLLLFSVLSASSSSLLRTTGGVAHHFNFEAAAAHNYGDVRWKGALR